MKVIADIEKRIIILSELEILKIKLGKALYFFLPSAKLKKSKNTSSVQQNQYQLLMFYF